MNRIPKATYSGESLLDSPAFSSFQRVPANVRKANAKTKEIAETARQYLTQITRESEAA
jgi:hypothetical protein